MTMRLRHIDDLSSQVGGARKALELLQELGIRVINGYYDSVRLEAALSEPSKLRNKRNEWSLSHRTGLGAVKYVLDPLNIKIVQHECRGAQWLMLEGSKRKRAYVKMYYKGHLAGARTLHCNFQVRNFLQEDAPEYFAFMCFEGPHMWVIQKRVLISGLKSLGGVRSKRLSTYDTFSIPDQLADHPYGALNALLYPEGHFYLTSSVQLGM